MNAIKTVTLSCFVSGLFSLGVAVADTLNGFDLSDPLIPRAEIMHGGPPRDGIPAIDAPKFIPVGDVNYLQDDDIVLGVANQGKARAYPTRILIWHEIVNDELNGQKIAVTYCPLCGTGMVFDRMTDNTERSFGVSGLLYNSDVLMYDRQTESLWSQLAMKAVSGPAKGTALNWLPVEHMRFAAWRRKYPDGEVLSTDTGFRRDYAADAYASYFASDETMFPVTHKRSDLPNKALVIGLIINGQAMAYPIQNLPANQAVSDSVGNTPVSVRYDPTDRLVEVTDSTGKPVPSVMSFWFAWQAFYPKTGLWTP